MTDGDPTAYNASANPLQGQHVIDQDQSDHAITQTNILKAAGTGCLWWGSGAASPVRHRSTAGRRSPDRPVGEVTRHAGRQDHQRGGRRRLRRLRGAGRIGAFGGDLPVRQQRDRAEAGAERSGCGVPRQRPDGTSRSRRRSRAGFTWVEPLGPDNSAVQTKSTAGAQGSATFQWKPKVADLGVTVKVTEAVNPDFSADRWSYDIKAADGTTTTESASITSTPSFQVFANRFRNQGLPDLQRLQPRLGDLHHQGSGR